MEAVELCGALADAGIEAQSEAGGAEGWLDANAEGAHRILVAPGDVERARQLLASK
ncbi:MAG TPA: hypothetical protein VGU02_13950 [Gaiellaceae bacterium]|nr:hypothetical protein [Gaiellaceae bacterium]